jgi:nucleoside-diphosphate-sugar epimerase
MRYFLTGATGFIGGHVARQLVEAGHEVRALVRNPARAAELRELGVTLYQGDITDRETMREPMAGVDGVFHLAAWYEVGVPDKSVAERINVQGTCNVLELAKELGVPKTVYTSSLVVFSDTGGNLVDESYRFHPSGAWPTEYERTKYVAHYDVAVPMMEAGLPLVIVQPGVNYGPGDTSTVRESLIDYLRGRLPAVPRDTAYCWAHVEDTARGHVQAMERGRVGESYIIAGPVHTVPEVYELAAKITGVPAPRIRLPNGVMRAMAFGMEVVGKAVPLPKAYRGESLRSTIGTYIGDNSKARYELGFKPRPLEEGLRETLLHEMRLLGMTTNE